MNPADQRVTELVDKWLKSLELHLAYTNLTDEAYWQVQPWVRHQRPARWILDLAHTRAKEVKRQLTARVASGDSSFSETLELMAFLANLVGVQSIERFIPLAEPERENREALGSTHSTLQPLNSTSTQTRTLIEPTREMRMPAPPAAASVPAPVSPPAPVAAPTLAAKPPPSPAPRAAPPPAPRPAPPPAPAPRAAAPGPPPPPAARVPPPVVPTLTVPVLVVPPPPAAPAPSPAIQPRPASPAANEARPEPEDVPIEESFIPSALLVPPARRAAAPKSAAPSAAPPGRAIKRENRTGSHKAGKPSPAEGIDAQVVADAVRLIKWGRAWHELAEAIARIADRPGVVEVRKILRTHKAEIERSCAE